MEDQIGDLTAFLKGMQARIDGQHDAVKKTLEANTMVLQDLSVWKPKVQADVDELQSSVRELCSKVEKLSLKQEELTNPAYKVFDTQHLNIPQSAAPPFVKSTSRDAGPSDRGDEHGHRGLEHGVVTTFVPTPVTGAKHSATLSPVPFNIGSALLTDVGQLSVNHALPLVEFPDFDGT